MILHFILILGIIDRVVVSFYLRELHVKNQDEEGIIGM